ncbi:hypothetical protein [Sporosarcina sp. UB5]|uniref:hypothetical protein n=1 Tax=Sporosarcina sp. UB5 TaxID=3047463 RepID=UPI003D7AC6D7
MAKESKPSWKNGHPSTFFSNSVLKVNHSVKQAQSHPEEMAVEHAFNSIERAEKALENAEQLNEHMDTVEQNKATLDSLKQQLEEVQEIVEDQK